MPIPYLKRGIYACLPVKHGLYVAVKLNFYVYFQGKITPRYVVEIHIFPWKPDDPRNKYPTGAMKTYPIHQDETGVVRIRRQAMVVTVSNLKVVLKFSYKFYWHIWPRKF